MEKVTKELIDDLKKQHKCKEIIEFVYKGESVLFKKPDRAIVGLSMAEGREDPAFGHARVFINNCWLWGNEKLKDDQDFQINLGSEADTIVGLINVEVKKH